MVSLCALQTQNFFYTDTFLLDRLLEIEAKCDLLHTMPITGILIYIQEKPVKCSGGAIGVRGTVPY